MKNVILPLVAIGLCLTVPVSAQQIAHVAGGTMPVPDSFEKQDCKDNFAFASGLRYAFTISERFSLGVGASHEWRRVRNRIGPEGDEASFQEVEGRAFLLQATGMYDLATCSKACGGTFGVMAGLDLSMPYRTNAQRFDPDGSEVDLRPDSEQFRPGLMIRAGVRYSMPICDVMGLFMEPQVMYRAVLDRTDQVALSGVESERVGDRLGLGMQGGIFLNLGQCAKGSAQDPVTP